MSDTPPNITSDMTVREVLARHPAARRVLDRFDLAGCGGPEGPNEPLGFFAKMHGADPDALIAEIESEIAPPSTAPAPPMPGAAKQAFTVLNNPEVAGKQGPGLSTPAPESASPEVDLYPMHLKAAILIATFGGALLGVINFIRTTGGGGFSIALNQLHGHLMIIGWVGLFVMGVAGHAIPRFTGSKITKPGRLSMAYWLVLAGVLLRIPGQPWAAQQPFSGIWVLSAAAELAGVSLFAGVLLATLANTAKREVYNPYLKAALLWFWVQAAAGLVLTAAAAAHGADAFPPEWDEALVAIQTLGFAGLMIYGFTLRTIPLFMGLLIGPERVFSALAWPANAAVVLTAAGLALGDGQAAEPLRAAGAVIFILTALLFTGFLHLFGQRLPSLPDGPSRAYEKFVLAAYVWLLVGGIMEAWVALSPLLGGGPVTFWAASAARHALTLGFVTTMIYGMALRIVPIFSGATFIPPGITLAIFLTHQLGVAFRVGHGMLAAIEPSPPAWMAGLSGILGLAGFLLFGGSLWMVLDHRARAPKGIPAAYPVTGEMVVGSILERFPPALDLLVARGFTMLANPILRKRLAGRVTLEQACRVHGRDPAALVTALNAALEPGRPPADAPVPSAPGAGSP